MKQRVIWIAWPAFVMAGVLEVLVFALVDPGDLRWLGGAPVEWSRQTVYSVAFFVFWAAIAAAGMLGTLLSMSPFEVNRCPVPPDHRPPDCARCDAVRPPS